MTLYSAQNMNGSIGVRDNVFPTSTGHNSPSVGGNTGGGIEEVPTPAPVNKTVAIRLTAESIGSLLRDFVSVTNNKELWEGITHIHWDYARLACDGTLVSASNEVLTSPSTYETMVREIAKKHGIEFVLSIPSYADDPYMTAVIRNSGSQLLRSIWTHAEFREHLEVDFHMMHSILAGPDIFLESRWYLLDCMQKASELKWTLSISNAVMLPEDAQRFMAKLLTKINVVAIVVRSFGFQDAMEIRTSHGNYRTLYIQPDCSLSQFITQLGVVRTLIPRDLFPQPRVIMEMDTRAVEYYRKRTHTGVAEHFELVPLREVRHRRMFGCTSYSEQFDANCSSAMIDFTERQTVVSYDSAECRKRKLDYVIEHELHGVLLGEPHYDISPISPSSLVGEAKARLRPADSPVSAVDGSSASPVCRLYGSKCPSIENHRGPDDEQGH